MMFEANGRLSSNGRSKLLPRGLIGKWFLRHSNRTQHDNLGALAGVVKKSVGVGFDLCFVQGFFYARACLFQRWHYLAWRAAAQSRHINVAVVSSNFGLRNNYEVAKTKVEVLLD